MKISVVSSVLKANDAVAAANRDRLEAQTCSVSTS